MLVLNYNLKDRDGKEISFGDIIELFDWGRLKENQQTMGYTKIVFDTDEGRISTEPCLVEDAYDFFTKCLPNCKLIERTSD